MWQADQWPCAWQQCLPPTLGGWEEEAVVLEEVEQEALPAAISLWMRGSVWSSRAMS